jgi:hypothetical protein
MPGDATTAFPLDQIVYTPVLYYVVGRSEMREDTFADDKRAETLLQRFSAMLMGLAA